MSKIVFGTKLLMVVRPSVCVYDNTYTKRGRLYHDARFENNSRNITIAEDCIGCFKDCFSGEVIYKVGHHCIEGDLHATVFKDDNVDLVKYLLMTSLGVDFETFSKNRNLIYNTVSPQFKIEALEGILNTLKRDLPKKEKVKVYKVVKEIKFDSNVVW